jgi:dihydrofolate reductase
MPNINEIFLIGGVSLIELALGKYSSLCKLLFVTRINKNFECDVFMPQNFNETHEDCKFKKIFISKTFSHKDITFDYTFYANQELV